MTPMHYLLWFTRGTRTPEGAFVPADGGAILEADQAAWELSEALRDTLGINLHAFLPALASIAQCEPEALPTPGRCLEVFTDQVVRDLRDLGTVTIKDLGHHPRALSADTLADGLEAYRARWQEGFYLVRVPQ